MERAHYLPSACGSNPDGNPTDEQLLALVEQKEVGAYEVLYVRYVSAVYTLILRIIRNRAMTEELVQDTFWRVMRNAASYRGHGPVSAWVLRIARNRALDELRRQKARSQKMETVSREVAWSQTSAAIVAAAAELQTHLDQQAVRQALAALPAEQRLCIELCYWEGWTHQEIAAYCQVAPGTVKSRLRLARQKLAAVLRSQGYP